MSGTNASHPGVVARRGVPRNVMGCRLGRCDGTASRMARRHNRRIRGSFAIHSRFVRATLSESQLIGFSGYRWSLVAHRMLRAPGSALPLCCARRPGYVQAAMRIAMHRVRRAHGSSGLAAQCWPSHVRPSVQPVRPRRQSDPAGHCQASHFHRKAGHHSAGTPSCSAFARVCS